MTTISSIVIDGYNLIGVSHRDLNQERERLIQSLSDYAKTRTGHDITLVFDGWKTGGAKEETLRKSGITVIYSRLGETADAVIKRILNGGSREFIVVTSDRDIAAHAWTRGSVPVPSEVFLSILGSAGMTSIAGPYDPLDDTDGTLRGKGSSRTLSKKEKAIQRSVRKLR